MQFQLKDLFLPPRIHVQKDLLLAFGSTVDGYDTKDLRTARIATEKAAKQDQSAKKVKAEDKSSNSQSQSQSQSQSKSKSKSQAKGHSKAKGKGKATKYVEISSEDDEEDEEDQLSQEDPDDATFVATDDERAEENPEEKEERARLAIERTRTNLDKHRSLVARNEEWTETVSLIVATKPDGRDKSAQTLQYDRWPPSFSQSWRKQSRFPKDSRPNTFMRGLALVDATTWEWKSVGSQTFNRSMRIFAAAAISESSIMNAYRHELISCHPNGGAAVIRRRAQDAVKPYLSSKDAGQTVSYRQTTLSDIFGASATPATGRPQGPQQSVVTEGDLPPTGCISWVDGIYINPDTSEISSHILEDELGRFQREKALGAQERAVQKIVDSVQNLRVAWHDASSTKKTSARDHPKLDEDVVLSLRSLVNVSPLAMPESSDFEAYSTYSTDIERECIPTTCNGDTYGLVPPLCCYAPVRASPHNHQRREGRRRQQQLRFRDGSYKDVVPKRYSYEGRHDPAPQGSRQTIRRMGGRSNEEKRREGGGGEV